MCIFLSLLAPPGHVCLKLNPSSVPSPVSEGPQPATGLSQLRDPIETGAVGEKIPHCSACWGLRKCYAPSVALASWQGHPLGILPLTCVPADGKSLTYLLFNMAPPKSGSQALHHLEPCLCVSACGG